MFYMAMFGMVAMNVLNFVLNGMIVWGDRDVLSAVWRGNSRASSSIKTGTGVGEAVVSATPVENGDITTRGARVRGVREGSHESGVYSVASGRDVSREGTPAEIGGLRKRQQGNSSAAAANGVGRKGSTVKAVHSALAAAVAEPAPEALQAMCS